MFCSEKDLKRHENFFLHRLTDMTINHYIEEDYEEDICYTDHSPCMPSPDGSDQ